MQSVEHAIDLSNKVTAGGVVGGLVFGLTDYQLGILASFVVGMVGVAVNAYYLHKRHKLLEKRFGADSTHYDDDFSIPTTHKPRGPKNGKE